MPKKVRLVLRSVQVGLFSFALVLAILGLLHYAATILFMIAALISVIELRLKES